MTRYLNYLSLVCYHRRMSYDGQRMLLIVGEYTTIAPLISLFQREGVHVERIEKVLDAIKTVIKMKPDGILFVVPQYWEEVTSFVEDIRNNPDLAHIPIIYAGGLIEGNDITILQQKGVKTITFGPVPNPEIVRCVMNEL